MIIGCDENQFGILAELSRVGFGHTALLQKDGGCYVRVTRISLGDAQGAARYRFDIVSPRTRLWFGGYEKSKDIVRWWKSPGQISSCEAAVMKHAGFSIDADQSFVMNGNGQRIAGSQKLLTSLS